MLWMKQSVVLPGSQLPRSPQKLPKMGVQGTPALDDLLLQCGVSLHFECVELLQNYGRLSTIFLTTLFCVCQTVETVSLYFFSSKPSAVMSDLIADILFSNMARRSTSFRSGRLIGHSEETLRLSESLLPLGLHSPYRDPSLEAHDLTT